MLPLHCGKAVCLFTTMPSPACTTAGLSSPTPRCSGGPGAWGAGALAGGSTLGEAGAGFEARPGPFHPCGAAPFAAVAGGGEEGSAAPPSYPAVLKRVTCPSHARFIPRTVSSGPSLGACTFRCPRRGRAGFRGRAGPVSQGSLRNRPARRPPRSPRAGRTLCDSAGTPHRRHGRVRLRGGRRGTRPGPGRGAGRTAARALLVPPSESARPAS